MLDLRPTLLALAGVEDPSPGRGRDLLAAPLDAEHSLVVENGDAYPHKTFGLRTPDWKYLRTDGGREELYELASDPEKLAQARRILATLLDPDLETWGFSRGEIEAQLDAAQPEAASRRPSRTSRTSPPSGSRCSRAPSTTPAWCRPGRSARCPRSYE